MSSNCVTAGKEWEKKNNITSFLFSVYLQIIPGIKKKKKIGAIQQMHNVINCKLQLYASKWWSARSNSAYFSPQHPPRLLPQPPPPPELQSVYEWVVLRRCVPGTGCDTVARRRCAGSVFGAVCLQVIMLPLCLRLQVHSEGWSKVGWKKMKEMKRIPSEKSQPWPRRCLSVWCFFDFHLINKAPLEGVPRCWDWYRCF